MANIRDTREAVGTCKIKLREPPVKVLVGPDKVAFYIQESVISKPGSFFEAALKKEWKEGQERTVELIEDNPDDFEFYAEWLFCRKIFIKQEGERRFGTIVRLYVLGEKLLDKDFQDDVIDAMIAATHDKEPSTHEKPGTRAVPADCAINLIYKVTPVGSPMRRMMVDYFLLFGSNLWTQQWSSESAGSVHYEFLIDITKAMVEKWQLNPLFHKALHELDVNLGCAYHHHVKDEPCSAMKQ